LVSKETKMPRILGKSSKVGNNQEEDESGNWACVCGKFNFAFKFWEKKFCL
jgi:uncharacterized cupin superfamily protein